MDVLHSRAALKKPPALHVAPPIMIPLVVVLFGTQVTLVIGARYVPFVLVGWCAVLLGSAAWLNQVLFSRVRTFLPFLAAIVTTLSIWFWQRQAFSALVPKAGLTYGYFLTPGGAQARFWVLVCPFWVGLACLSVCCIVALVLWWRESARGSLGYMVPWWLATFVIFALPSVYLDGQGNASIFI
jgi:hypothetical protein